MKVLTEFERRPLYFDNPKEIISCTTIANVAQCFSLMEQAVKGGYYLAGFLSYEAGYAFENKLSNDRKFDFPLLHFGVFDPPETKSPDLETATFSRRFPCNINISKSQYFQNIEKIKKYISYGDVYQITYCIKFLFDYLGNPYGLYQRLYKDQWVPYPAFIETDDFNILSLSPELFMKKRGNHITTKPMKGTWHRGKNFWQDLFAGRELKYDEKNRAENVMIADLLRNDLGRIGTTIKAPTLFEVAKYKTLFQMTSTVTANIDKDISLFKLFKALHPSGSVTGAPKIRAMEIIKELEPEGRRIYTGAIGYITPKKDLFFNVPIRTLLLKDRHGEMGVGGGIVWDSTSQGEFDECILKASFLSENRSYIN